MINISLEPRTPVILHLALALFSSSPDLRTQLPEVDSTISHALLA